MDQMAFFGNSVLEFKSVVEIIQLGAGDELRIDCAGRIELLGNGGYPLWPPVSFWDYLNFPKEIRVS